jgi:hypothetical protein
MGLKSAYKEKTPDNILPEIPAEPNIPQVEINGMPADPVAEISTDGGDDSEPESVPLPAAVEIDASNALAAQIAALKRSGELQRQRQEAAAMAARGQPMSRTQKLDLWETQGMPKEERAWFEKHPELIDRPDVTAAAALEAERQGHQRGSKAHRKATRNIFHQIIGGKGSTQPTPQFFQPPAVEPNEPDEVSEAIFSASISRETPTAAGVYREPLPSSVRLSIEEKQIAKNSGISEVEYARQKLRMLKAQETGELQK